MTDYCQDFSSPDGSEPPRLFRKSLGATGEAIAAAYLQQSGWRIERRGFRLGRSSEADLIAVDGLGLTAIIEVKTRSFRAKTRSSWYESAVQSVDVEKRRRLITVMQRFHAFFDPNTEGYRLDVIFIGIECSLVDTLIDLKKADSPSLFLDLIATTARNFLAGDDEKLQIIHCQEAFVTNS